MIAFRLNDETKNQFGSVLNVRNVCFFSLVFSFLFSVFSTTIDFVYVYMCVHYSYWFLYSHLFDSLFILIVYTIDIHFKNSIQWNKGYSRYECQCAFLMCAQLHCHSFHIIQVIVVQVKQFFLIVY